MKNWTEVANGHIIEAKEHQISCLKDEVKELKDVVVLAYYDGNYDGKDGFCDQPGSHSAAVLKDPCDEYNSEMLRKTRGGGK